MRCPETGQCTNVTSMTSVDCIAAALYRLSSSANGKTTCLCFTAHPIPSLPRQCQYWINTELPICRQLLLLEWTRLNFDWIILALAAIREVKHKVYGHSSTIICLASISQPASKNHFHTKYGMKITHCMSEEPNRAQSCMITHHCPRTGNDNKMTRVYMHTVM